MRILVCDDDDDTREMLCDLVQTLGHEPVGVGTGEEALAVMSAEGAPQVALLDLMLPDGSGIDVCRRLREKRSLLDTYVIMLTALRESKTAVESLRAGANDYVVKPFALEELTARLGNGIRIIELQREVQQLSGLLPICAWCKKIREADETWVSIERYLADRSTATFTHGACPECEARLLASIPRNGSGKARSGG